MECIGMGWMGIKHKVDMEVILEERDMTRCVCVGKDWLGRILEIYEGDNNGNEV